MNPPIRFGTDGVRGPAGEWPLDHAGARTIGRGIAAWVGKARVLVGRDTRESGPALESALIEGLVSGGVSAVRMGVVPTAAVSMAVLSDDKAKAGVMLTASHNPWADNGIKVVDHRGEKLLDATALTTHFHGCTSDSNGTISTHPDPLGPWRSAMPTVDLNGRRILLDGAHGAGADAATQVLEAAGATVTRIGCTPNGTNINEGVGAMHPPTDLHGCEFAICLDGDADRLVMVDPTHGVLNGDDLLWMLSRDSNGPLVGTVMTNGGLEAALDGRLVRTAVGDAKVWAEMIRINSAMGGEPSGHIMMRDGLPTSDGLYTALRILEIADGGPLPLGGWVRWPQSQRNVRDVSVDKELASIKQAENAGCRVLVRASGTEPLVRVMVEGTGAELWADRIAAELPKS